MKKIVNIVAIFLVLFLFSFSINLYASSLSNINVSTDKETVHPGEEIKINIEFGESLGAYNFYIAYDNNLLEYVSGEGGIISDHGTRVQILFHDETGGSNPRNNLYIVFRAKEGIVTSNPTDLSVTAEGLGSPDASISYDDITTPIKKNIVVEPQYEDYKIELNYTGEIQKNEEKDMELVISSSMGKNYEHTRIIAEAVTPDNETVKLLATDSQDLEHDMIQSGWGEIQGDSIGGKDVRKELKIRGLFSGAGNYQITFKLIDRDNSDAEIASETFHIAVLDEVINEGGNTQVPGEEQPEQQPEETPETKPEIEENLTMEEETNTIEQMPTTLPKTGSTIYVSLFSLIATITAGYFIYQKKN